MLLGYLYIIIAGTLWGGSAVAGKFMMTRGMADPALLSQVRVTFSWVLILLYCLVFNRRKLVVGLDDLWRFVLLGAIGVAGANYLLYMAVTRMSTAVADLIQFTAPAMAAIWLWMRGQETLGTRKSAALLLSLAGCTLALGVSRAGLDISLPALIGAVGSALCYAFLLVFGKGLTHRYTPPAYLHYAFLASAVFWAFVVPPWRLPDVIQTGPRFGMFLTFACTSALIPYVLFFAGLQRVPAANAGIVSTWEPVMVTVTGWSFLGESLSTLQVFGILLVIAAIVLIEVSREPVIESRQETG